MTTLTKRSPPRRRPEISLLLCKVNQIALVGRSY